MFGSLWNNVEDYWRDTKDSFSGKNTKDPIPRIAGLLSPSNMFSNAKIGYGPMDLGKIIPDKVNANISKDIWGNKPGEGNWLSNKTATDIGGLVSAGMFGAGAFGGGLFGGGQSAIPTGPSTAELMAAGPGGASNAAAAGAAGGAGAAGIDGAFDWKSLLPSASGMGGGGGGQQQAAGQPGYVPPQSNEPNWAALLAQPQQPQQAQPQAPQPTSWSDRLMSNLNSPQAQLGLRMLANNRDGASFGNVLGQSGIEQLQANAQAQQAQLQQRMMEAQIRKLEQPDTNQQNDPASVAEYKFARQNGFKGSFEEWVTAGGQTSRPSSVQEWEFFQRLPKDQQKLYLEMKRNPNMSVQSIAGVPNVVAPSNLGTAVVPLSTEQRELDARNRAAAAQSSGTTTGTATATARMDLPQAIATAEQGIKNIDALLASPGFPRIFGFQGALPIIPGTTRADSRALLEQIQGQVFLQAYESLKGGGQITEVEGKKAEAAKARLQRAQSPEAAKKALNELKEIILNGIERAKKKAGSAGSANRVKVDAQGNVIQ